MRESFGDPRPDDLLLVTERGLFCPAGGFHIDPWLPVDRAILTHAHSDHARPGSARYLVAAAGLTVMRERLGPDARIDSTSYGAGHTFGEVRVSLHPAGHVLGAAQIRLEGRGAGGRREVWVVTGDYKRQPDPTCDPFEPLTCDVFVTESTFGLPIYRWEPPAATFAAINSWWRENRARNVTSVVFAYALGKA
jgi:putative mRNA 3-end processing factor